MLSETKRCYRCSETKELTQFYKNKSKHDGATSECRLCIKELGKEAYKNNRESKLLYQKKYYQENKTKVDACIKEWRSKHPEKLCKYALTFKERHPDAVRDNSKRWRELYPWKHAAKEAKRRAAKKCAVPKWADLIWINSYYKLAKFVRLQVDHIVPVQSNLVCGLHCEDNLQLLPKDMNLSKGNYYWPNMAGGY